MENMYGKLNKDYFSNALIFIISAFALISFFQDSDIILLVIFYFISVSGVLYIKYEEIRFSTAMTFFLSVYCATFSLIVKPLLGQKLEQNLFNADASAIYILIFYINILFISKVCLKFNKPSKMMKQVFNYFNDKKVLKKYTLYIFAIGVAFKLLHTALHPEVTSGQLVQSNKGFGGFGNFTFLMYLGMCMQVSIFLRETKNKTERNKTILMSLAIILLAIISNKKYDLFQLIVIFIFGLYAYNIKITLKSLIVYSFLALILIIYVSATVMIMRPFVNTSGLTSKLSVSEKLELGYEVLKANNFNVSKLSKKTNSYLSSFSSFNPSDEYFFPYEGNIGRYSLLKPLDIAASQKKEDTGSEIDFFTVMNNTFNNILPSIIAKHTTFVLADMFAWKYGMSSYGNVRRPVIGFPATAYASLGVIGIVVLTWLFIFPMYLIFNYISGKLLNNTWSLFIISSNIYLCEKEYDYYISLILRVLPIILITVFIIIYFTKLKKKAALV